MQPECFVDVQHAHLCKARQRVSGDVFLSDRIRDEDRTVAVLADGLGSGIKAGVLATLTATMALKCVSNRIDIRRTAELIMGTLPVCRERHIAYSTFTIVDVAANGTTHVIEHENPAFLLLRDQRWLDVPKQVVALDRRRRASRHHQLQFAAFEARQGDRIILFSDGVNQSGMGRATTPLGWGIANVKQYVQACISRDPDLSGLCLARAIVHEAARNDSGRAKDDITCAVIHFRRPRELLVMTGPPVARENDRELASMLAAFDGRKIISGGTTASIISRELGRGVTVHLNDAATGIPPTSEMAGVDLVTEGTLTLGAVAEMLEHDAQPDSWPENGAGRMVRLLLDSDVIRFVVGTRINDAHQDPNIPVELDIRRNLIRRIRTCLETTHLKETDLRLV